MSRDGITEFIERWCRLGERSEPVDAEGLAEVELELGFTLPKAYRSSVLSHGLPSPDISLLEFIDDNELDVPDIGGFHSPAEIVSSTRNWCELGMPSHLVAFASDSGGNQFAFSREKPAEVWYYDHDFDEAKKVSDDFSAWVCRYVEL